MKIQGAGGSYVPQQIADVGRGAQIGQQPIQQLQQAVTPENFLDGYEGVKAGQPGSLDATTQLPELDFDKLSDLSKEVNQKMQEAHAGHRGGGKKDVQDDDEDLDGDGIPDNQE